MLNNLYRGIIEDNNSPLKDGRVKVRIFGIHSEDKTLVPTDTLPWAEVLQPLSFGFGTGIGITSVPRTGTMVFVTLEMDNPNKPIVIGAVSGQPTESNEYQLPMKDRLNQYDTNDLANPGYPNNHVIETLAGHIIEIDDNAGNERIRICHTNGNEILLNNEGISVTSVKNRNETSSGNFTQTVLGTISVNANGAIQFNTSGSMNISCSGDANIKANGNINATSAQSINLKSLVDTNIIVGGDATLNVTGSTTATIGAGLTANVTGATSITTSSTGEFKSGGAMKIQGSQVTIIGGSTMVI